MLSLREQARRVDLAGLTSTPTIAALTAPDVEEFLGRIGMRQLCARLTPQVILDASREARNPYEN
jgi:hypothetical protein